MIFAVVLLLLVASMPFGLASLLHRFFGPRRFWARVVLAGVTPFALLFIFVLWISVSNGRTLVDVLNLMALIPLEGKLLQGGILVTSLAVSLATSTWCKIRAEQELDPRNIFE